MINEAFSPGHFYSVIPSITKDYSNNEPIFSNLDFNETSHTTILNDLPTYLTRFDTEFGVENNSNLSTIVNQRHTELKYSLMNGAFEWMDARLLHYFLQKNHPKKLIEIGSGNSTLMAHNTNMMFNLNIEIICIEPYPSDYLKVLHDKGHIQLIQSKLEDIDLTMFTLLEENDILFIDSSHVLKLNSDVLFYFTKIFPLVKKGVLVHIHDIFFPNDYPLEWLKEGRFWNEQYFLYVFLQYNTKYKIEFCNSYALFKYHNQLKELQKDCYEMRYQFSMTVFGGGSIWIRVME